MEILSSQQWELLFSIASRIVPEAAGLVPEERARFCAIIADALDERPPAMRKQLRVFLGLLARAPVVRFGAPFERLNGAQQDRVLRWFQDCPVALLRKGFWGLKALVFMGYYARPEVAPGLRYTPSFSGNEMLHA